MAAGPCRRASRSNSCSDSEAEVLDRASTAETTRAHSSLWPCRQLATWQSLLQYTTDKHLPASAHARQDGVSASTCPHPRTPGKTVSVHGSVSLLLPAGAVSQLQRCCSKDCQDFATAP